MLCSGSLSSLSESGILQCFFSLPRVLHTCVQAFNILALLDFFARSRGSAFPASPHTQDTNAFCISPVYVSSSAVFDVISQSFAWLGFLIGLFCGRGPRLFTTPVGSLLSPDYLGTPPLLAEASRALSVLREIIKWYLTFCTGWLLCCLTETDE